MYKLEISMVHIRVLICTCAHMHIHIYYTRLACHPANLRVRFFDFPWRSFHAFFKRDSHWPANTRLLKLPTLFEFSGVPTILFFYRESGLSVNSLKYYVPSKSQLFFQHLSMLKISKHNPFSIAC